MSANLINTTDRQPNGWLPPLQQVIDVLQFRLDAVVGAMRDQREAVAPAAIDAPEMTSDPELLSANVDNPPLLSEVIVRSVAPITSMRQGMGLVVVTALIAGALPFLFNWAIAARAGTALPLVQLAGTMDQPADATSSLPWLAWEETLKSIAGLEPRLPGWLAAGLSALGVWINQPLTWLTYWLVYGLGILLVCKLLGATTTLQRFYAVTSYAYLPLLLTMLQPIPYLGPLAALVAIVWTFVLYVRIVQLLTGLNTGRAVLSVLLPGALGLLVALLAAGAFIISLVRMTM